MSEPTLHDILHILRNPYGWSQDAIRAAQLKACDLLESAAAPVPAREWIPVGERLPEYDAAVLIYPIEQSKTVARIPKVTWPQVGALTKGGGWFSRTYGGLGSSGAIVGYWMPLPLPPAADK